MSTLGLIDPPLESATIAQLCCEISKISVFNPDRLLFLHRVQSGKKTMRHSKEKDIIERNLEKSHTYSICLELGAVLLAVFRKSWENIPLQYPALFPHVGES
jgi:hypothetical protein